MNNATRRHAATLLAAFTLALALTACTRGTPQTSPPVADPTNSAPSTPSANPMPTRLAVPGNPGSTPTEPPGLPGDIPNDIAEFAKTLIGKPDIEAQTLTQQAGYTYRIVRRDGQDYVVTMDYSTDRINVDIVDGRVTNTSIG